MEEEQPSKKRKIEKRNFHGDATFADFKIKFGENELLVHKVVIAQSSEFFYKACTAPFKESIAGEIDLGEDNDPEAVRAMFRHIYNLAYDVVPPAENEAGKPITDLLFHVNVFTLADRYDIQTLRPLVVRNFLSLIDQSWEDESFIAALVRIYSCEFVDESLRCTVVKFCISRIDDLVKFQTFCDLLKDAPFPGW